MISNPRVSACAMRSYVSARARISRMLRLLPVHVHDVTVICRSRFCRRQRLSKPH